MPDEHETMELPQPKCTGTAINTPPKADDEEEGE